MGMSYSGVWPFFRIFKGKIIIFSRDFPEFLQFVLFSLFASWMIFLMVSYSFLGFFSSCLPEFVFIVCLLFG